VAGVSITKEVSMRRPYTTGLVVALALAAAGALGCAGGQEKNAAAGDPREQAWLRQTKEQLEAKRQDLAELRQQQREAPVAAASTPVADQGDTDGIAARIEALEAEITELSDELGSRLVNYINSLEIALNEPFTPEQQEALRMKSDEDIAIAQEWIEKGGDYRRALEIYDGQLAWDPDYAPLREAREHAQSMRYMTQERFAGVTKGMTQSEVREALGPVNLHNLRKYPERDAEAWFYPKDGGGAAAVYFMLDKKKGLYTVYQTDFEIKSQQEGGSA
jgi:hypothetical protein